MYIAWTIEIVPKHCFRKAAYLCLIEMKRELHRTTKHENVNVRPEKIQFSQKGQNRNFGKNPKFIF